MAYASHFPFLSLKFINKMGRTLSPSGFSQYQMSHIRRPLHVMLFPRLQRKQVPWELQQHSPRDCLGDNSVAVQVSFRQRLDRAEGVAQLVGCFPGTW